MREIDTVIDGMTERSSPARDDLALPRNEVADLCHMSGECLCGAFAHDGERDELSQWYPEPFDEIAELERLIADRSDIPDNRKTWGWGGDAEVLKASKASRKQPRTTTGYLCGKCDSHLNQLELSLQKQTPAQ
jgi:hypothetical protein